GACKLDCLHAAMLAPDADGVIAIGDPVRDIGGHGSRAFGAERERCAGRAQIFEVIGGAAQRIVIRSRNEDEERLSIRTRNALVLLACVAHGALPPVSARMEVRPPPRLKTTRSAGPASVLKIPGAISRVPSETAASVTRRRACGSRRRKAS